MSTNDFYNRLRDMSLSKGLTPHKLMIELGISRSLPGAWKKGSTPTATTLKKIADFFGIPPQEMLGETTEKNVQETVEPQAPSSLSVADSNKDYKMGYLEGKIEQLEKQVRDYKAQTERQETRISDVLNRIEELLQDKKTAGTATEKRPRLADTAVYR